MSKETKNYKLFKWDITNQSDLGSSFNIEKALNENWDKIDDGMSENADNILSLQNNSGSILELVLDNSTFILSATLKNANKEVISTASVDFPVEQLILNLTYDNTTKDLVITLQNRQVRRIPLLDIIDGLVRQSDFDDLYDEVIELKENLTDNTDNIEQLQEENAELKEDLSDAEDNQLTAPANGESIDLSDSANAKIREPKLIGKSWQNSTTGANVMKFTPRTVTNQGINYICDNGGSVKLTGTATSGLELAYNQSQDKLTLANGTYKLKCVGNNIPTVLKRTDTNTSFNLDLNGEATITIDADNTEFRILIFATNGTTYNYDFYITLTPGTTATTERYTGRNSKP